MGSFDQAIGLFVFFPLLTTITVGLRLWVRTRVNRGSFGYDDVALLITYIGLLLWVGLASAAFQHPIGSPAYTKWDAAKADVCYIISGTVKVSVALVLYRLDTRRIIRAILITDIVVCTVWTIVATFILALGCTGDWVPVPMSSSVCQATNYAQEASYVIFNVLHLVIPVAILWNVQLSRTLKWGIVALFGVGLLAAVAAVMKLVVYVKLYHDPSPATKHSLQYQTQIWSVTEHGLSLFAASILALKPVYGYLSRGWSRLSGSFSGASKDSRMTTASSPSSSPRSAQFKRKHMWYEDPTTVMTMTNLSTNTTTTTMDLGTIDVRNDVEVKSEVNVEQLRHPAYIVDAYNDSQRRLVETGGKGLEAV